MNQTLSIVGLQKTFERGQALEKQVLKQVSLTLAPGEFISVIGSNGAGKSTLINCIAGAVTADNGTIRLDGEDITKKRTDLRAKDVARVFQDPKLGTAGHLSVEENLAIADRRGQKNRFKRGVHGSDLARFREKLAVLDLGLESRLHAPADTLSGGQRQALTLIMATMQRPKLLLLDEHTAALDPKASMMVMQLTEQLVREMKQTTMMITHNMENAIRYGDRLIMLHDGEIVIDVRGEAKKRLTVAELVDRFRHATGDAVVSDRQVLSGEALAAM
ncbi:MAG TPA: ATP-binding cassette domain-containing protein [Clostridiaceae bacterium]|nr:ATP-binding cassette domain-containing protein [Clostridiaceae bacterium]